MRWTIAAVLSVMFLLTAACQDGELERLRAENEDLKNNDNGGGNDKLIELLLAERQGGGDSDALERKLNSFSEDVQAGLSSIREDIRKSEDATDDRMATLEDRLDRVSDLESTIGSLKGTIETLEGKVQSVDPNETLSEMKAKLQLEHDLEREREALEQAEARIEELKQMLESAEAEREALNGEIATLQGEDISGHPEYRALQAELREARSESANRKSDYEILDRKYKSLLEQVGSNDEPADEETTKLLEDYEFAGRVTNVDKPKPDDPSILLVGQFRGTTPPLGAQLIVLDEKNNRICDVKVIRHYRVNDNDDLAVEELGCETVNESPTNPVTENDRVVWIRGDEDEDQPAGSAGGE